MRIVVDMQGAQIGSRFRGIGCYTMALARGLVRHRGPHEVLLALNGALEDSIEPIRAAFDDLLPQDMIKVWHGLRPLSEEQGEYALNRELAELAREAFLCSLRPDIVHVSSYFEDCGEGVVVGLGCMDADVPVSVSVYDFIPLIHRERYLDAHPAYARQYLAKIEQMRGAQVFLAISESSRRECCEYLGVPASAVVNVSAGADACFTSPVPHDGVFADTLRRWGVAKPYLLYTGGGDTRKNLLRLVQAYALLPAALRAQHQLVVAGKLEADDIARLKAMLQEQDIPSEELVFTGYITDAELVQLYARCTLFVFPSLHEGFGLPVLEAMACGAPVIAAGVTSIPEILDYSEALFDPLDTDAIRGKLELFLTDASRRDALAAYGLERARQFSWDRTAQRALAAMEAVVAQRTTAPLPCDPDALVAAAIDKASSLALRTYNQEQRVNWADVADALAWAGRTGRRRQLFVDVSALVKTDARTGVHRVTRSLLHALREAAADTFDVLAVYASTTSRGYRHASGVVDFAAPAALADTCIDYQPGDVFLGLDLAHETLTHQAAFLQSMRSEGVQVWVVVYDLLPVQMPQAFTPSVDEWHRLWLKTLAELDGALCISQAVAADLAQWLQVHGPQRRRPLRVDWFHLGADLANSVPSTGKPADAEEVLCRLRERPSFLCVGTIEPRKGIASVLDAMDVLWQQGADANLVLVGKAGWRVEPLLDRIRTHPQRGHRLFWLEGISDEYLEAVYAASTVLVAASEGEGFGLPLIEAAQHGLPLIARDIPVFREVAGTHAYFFEDASAAGLAESLQTWLALHARGAHPRSEGMPWLTWAQSARQLLSVLLAPGPRVLHGDGRVLPPQEAYPWIQGSARRGSHEVARLERDRGAAVGTVNIE